MICSVEGCTRNILARQLCSMHYERFRKYGTPLGGGPLKLAKGLTTAFLRRAADEVSDQCLPWPYARDASGYGRVNIGGGSTLAHRVVCERVNGPAPIDAPEAAHICGNGHMGCVNGRHLVWKDRRGNSEDMVLHGRSNRGQKMHASKLTEDDVKAIWSSKNVKTAVLARQFGVNYVSIRSIRNGKNWKWLTSQLEA